MGDIRSEFQRHGYRGHQERQRYEPNDQRRGGESPQREIKFRDEGNLRKALLTTEAEDWGDRFVHPEKGEKPLNSTQLRRFYNDVKALEARIDATGFEENMALVGMLRSKVAYACPDKGEKKVPTVFKEFIEAGVKAVKNEENFKDFVLFFEAVVGFFYGKGGR